MLFLALLHRMPEFLAALRAGLPQGLLPVAAENMLTGMATKAQRQFHKLQPRALVGSVTNHGLKAELQ